ncbi:MAG: hypothetical protein ACRC1M_08385, partial [Methanobacteriaceae archaeon]
KIINLIEDEAHTSGLTDRVKEQLYLLVDGEIPENFNEESNFDNDGDSGNSYDDTDNVNVNNDVNVNESNPEVIYPNNNNSNNNNNEVSDLNSEDSMDSEVIDNDNKEFNAASSSSSKPFNFNWGKRKPTHSVCTPYGGNSSGDSYMDNKDSKNNNSNNGNQNNRNQNNRDQTNRNQNNMNSNNRHSNNRNTHKKDFYTSNSNNNSNNKKRPNVEFDEEGLEKPTLQNITD